jgi:hypothetical protein
MIIIIDPPGAATFIITMGSMATIHASYQDFLVFIIRAC